MKLQRDLREFIELLNSHGVEYLVMGGHAVAFHGHPRFTGDIDFLIKSSETNAEKMVSALTAFGLADAASLRSTFTEAEKIIQLGLPPNRIDIMTSVSGVDFDELWSGGIVSELDGLPVRFPALQGLLKNKRASGRTKDLADLEQLEAMVGKQPPKKRQ